MMVKQSKPADYRAASFLRLWESLIHPQHSSMKIASFYGLSDQKNKLESNPVTDTKNNYNNKCVENSLSLSLTVLFDYLAHIEQGCL